MGFEFCWLKPGLDRGVFLEKRTIKEKSYAFALQIIALSRELSARNEFVLAKQVLKSGTSIGANVAEASAGQSKADFIAKMSIASKEARETEYWLSLLRDSTLITSQLADPLLAEAQEIRKMLTSIVKTAQENQKSRN
jgi:four helix bundle protein